MKRILTAIIVDPMGWSQETAEEEIVRISKQFSEALAPAVLDIYAPHSAYPSDIRPGTDLILFDYGGMMPGTDMPERNSRELVRWAEDHPSSLVVVISEMTYDHYVRTQIVDDLGKDALHNIIVSCAGDEIPDWFKKEAA